MIEFKHLQLVRAIQEHGSLTAAAKHLHLTQSALSYQLKQLEETLSVRLFERVNNQLVFTSAGRELLERGESILGGVEELEKRMSELKSVRPERYVHGYSNKEMSRLLDQASTVAEYIHWDSFWEPGAVVLEAGCGVGAQTQIIAGQNPAVQFISVDISEQSITKTRARMQVQGLDNVQCSVQDLRNLEYPNGHFDHVFVCFVLEHVEDVSQILRELGRVLNSGGTITVVEGDHGSTYFYPESAAAERAVAAQVALQERNGGNANIGRSLNQLLAGNGFGKVTVSPRQIYVSPTKPALYDAFVRKTFTAMIEGVRDEAVARGIIGARDMEAGIRDLYRVADTRGTFCYTFFKGEAVKL